MRSVSFLIVSGWCLAACGQPSPDDSQSRVTAPIIEHDEAIADLSQTDRPGPAIEEEAGVGIDRGLAIGDGARNDFENFLMSGEGVSVERNVAAVDGELRADRLTMDYNTFFGLYRSDVPVEAGRRFEGRVTLWTVTEPASFVLQIADFCSQNDADVESLTIEVGSQPTEYRIAHTFERTHTCALLRVTNVTEGGAEVFAADAALAAR